MHYKTIAAPCWSTASFGDSADTSPMELSALGEHLGLCTRTRAHVVTLQCVAETMNGFVSSRFVTTLALAALLIGIGSLLS
jgi:hypothetical protein